VIGVEFYRSRGQVPTVLRRRGVRLKSLEV
jgi:hypothetical protein